MKFLLVSFNAQMILDSFSFFPALSSLISSKFSVEFLCILLKYYQGYPKGEFIFYLFYLFICFAMFYLLDCQIFSSMKNGISRVMVEFRQDFRAPFLVLYVCL